MSQAARMIVWTRSRLDWAEDRMLVGDLPCLHVPLVEFVPVTDPPPALHARYAIITSPHAVHFAKQVPGAMARLKSFTQLFTFGHKTEQALREAGLDVTRVDARQGADMIPILAGLVRPGSAFWVVGARSLAFDAVSVLTEGGFLAAHWVLYETRPEAQLSPVHRKALHETPAAVAVASPSAVDALQAGLARSGLSLHPESHVVCMGETTASRARQHFRHVAVAEHPKLPSLVACAAHFLNLPPQEA